jgi:rubrerythrin
VEALHAILGEDGAMNIQSLFKHLDDMERVLGRLYLWFSEIFAADPGAVALFYRMSLEEKAHASTIQYLKRVVRRDPKLFQDVEVDFEEVQAICARASAILEKSVTMTLEKALKLALSLEESSAEYHYRNAILYANPDLAALMKSLASADKQHLMGLRDFARAMGYERLLAKPLPRFPNL